MPTRLPNTWYAAWWTLLNANGAQPDKRSRNPYAKALVTVSVTITSKILAALRLPCV
jgi:hypothetical protein